MRNTIILLLLFLLFGGVAFYYLSNDQGDSNRWDTRLTIEDTDRIHKIFLAKKTGQSYTLTREGDDWVVNGQYKVRPAKMHYLLETLEKQRVKYIPSKNKSETAVKHIASHGIKVETYDKNDEPILTFYVGGTTDHGAATFMIEEDSNQPLVMEIPKFVGSLRVRFWDEMDKWRDRSVFRYQSQDIQRLKVDYPTKKSSSFEIVKTAGQYAVEPVYKTTPVAQKAASQAIVKHYLQELDGKLSEGFINDFDEKHDIQKQVPFCIVTMTNAAGETAYVRLFPENPEAGFEQPSESVREFINNGNISRYYIDNNGEDFQLGQQIVLGKLFVSYDYFFR